MQVESPESHPVFRPKHGDENRGQSQKQTNQGPAIPIHPGVRLCVRTGVK